MAIPWVTLLVVHLNDLGHGRGGDVMVVAIALVWDHEKITAARTQDARRLVQVADEIWHIFDAVTAEYSVKSGGLDDRQIAQR